MVATAGAALALGAGVAWWRIAGRGSPSSDADALFALTFDDADGVAQPLARWRGTLLVVNFWATWCAPCVDEMPELNRVRAEYRSRGVEVIGIGIDSRERIHAFRERHGIGFPLLVAGVGGGELARRLGSSASVLPYTLLVTPDGTIAQRRVGRIQEHELRAWLDTRTGYSRGRR
jgi:peroxiredoxin